MIKKAELMKAQQTSNLPLSTIEKDYVLSLIIWGIAKHKDIGSTWVFKGGTALKKCYFGDYRFSEDLDYTLTQHASTDANFILQALTSVFENIYAIFGLKVEAKDIVVQPFPDKNGLVLQIKVPYQGPLLSSGSLPKIKLDLSADEMLADEPEARTLLHRYSDADSLDAKVLCYSMYEIFAEKLRAFAQRTRPRDLYDIVHLQKYFIEHNYDRQFLQKVAIAKFRHKGLVFPDVLRNLDKGAIDEAKVDWNNMLLHQVAGLPSFEMFMAEVDKVIGWVSSDA